MEFIKPSKLRKGDTVAVLSPSWGGPAVFPYIYENGLRILKEWGLIIKEFPSTRADPKYLSENPEFRAKDVNDAFADKNIKAIFASIGGDDSIKILPYLDKKLISENPKIIMGYSDTTTLHTFCNALGNITFHGPAIMAGFSQMENLPQKFKSHVYEMLFESKNEYEYKPYLQFSDGYPSWMDKNNIGKAEELQTDNGWKFIQGEGITRGKLFGGCIEIFDTLINSDFWPDKNFWDGKIFFLETSEEKPSVQEVEKMLSNYNPDFFKKISALLFGRARDYTMEEKLELDRAIKRVVTEKFNRPDLTIITNMDFGHTDPQIVLPLGVTAEINCTKKTFRLIEHWLK